MKNPLRPSPCGCRRPPPPREEEPWGRMPPPAPPTWGGYLMQRVFAAGTLRRRVCHSLCLEALPQQAQAPFTVTDAALCGPPRWEEAPCRNPRGMLLQVSIPVQFQVRDAQGCTYCLTDEIEENLPLRVQCAPDSCWRGQPYVQAAVRLAGRANPCGCDCRCEVPLDVLIEGYILAPCVMGRPDAPPPCPPGRPWYPQPMYDPYN
ncbi:MAG: hypothetical protein IKO52_12140 [Clostridia bacterium]|nr:hypothetical protein [Clostridia bacterium]